MYHVRDASIDRPDLHLDFDDGTLAFTEDICGRITGAFFEGEGEIRLRPPNRVERGSLALFTGMAILEEQFTSAYLRFNDDTAAVLQPFLNACSRGRGIRQKNGAMRAAHWPSSTRCVCCLISAIFLPAHGRRDPDRKFPLCCTLICWARSWAALKCSGMRLAPSRCGQGSRRVKDGALFFDIWTSFAPSCASNSAAEWRSNDVSIKRFRIQASVRAADDVAEPRRSWMLGFTAEESERCLFELSRYLKVEAVEADGRPVDFIQNPAIEGTQLQRKGNDLVAVVFPAPLVPGQELKLRFRYAGDVLSDAGNGLLYVGERGTWYPNFGLSPAQFEMEFHYPANWTLVATGKQNRRHDDAATTETSEERSGEDFAMDLRASRFRSRASIWASTCAPKRRRGTSGRSVRHQGSGEIVSQGAAGVD